MEMVAGVCVCTHADVHTHVWSQTHTDQEGKNMQESYGKHPNRRHASREASTETKQQCAFISSHPILTLTLKPPGHTHAHAHTHTHTHACTHTHKHTQQSTIGLMISSRTGL